MKVVTRVRKKISLSNEDIKRLLELEDNEEVTEVIGSALINMDSEIKCEIIVEVKNDNK